MKKILLSLGLLSLVATYAVADIKMEQMNLGEIQAGKFYGEKGVSINTVPVVFYDDFKFMDTNFLFMGQPHVNMGVQEGGHFMGEIGATDSISIFSTSEIVPTLFYGANLKTFTASSEKTTLNIDDEEVKTESKERYTDITIRAGYMFQYRNVGLIVGVEKGVLTGDVDFERFAGLNILTDHGAFGVELRKTDIGDDNKDTVTASYTLSF